MKNFSDFINKNSDIGLYENFEDEMLLEGKFLNKVANFLGDGARHMQSAWTDIKHFGKNVKLAYNGIAANMVNDKDALPKDIRKKIANDINSKEAGSKEQMDYIINVWNNNSDNPEYNTSGFMVYALLFGREIALENNLIKYENLFNNAIKSIDKETKKKAKQEKDQASQAEPDDEVGDSSEQNNEKNTGKTEEPQKTDGQHEEASAEEKKEIKSDTEKVIKNNSDMLSDLAKKAGVNGNKLRDLVTDRLSKINGKRI